MNTENRVNATEAEQNYLAARELRALNQQKMVYVIEQKYYDSGKMELDFYLTPKDQVPENSKQKTFDHYFDTFETKSDAILFLKDCEEVSNMTIEECINRIKNLPAK
jgi:hypothetical protein